MGIPRVGVILTHNRPELLAACVAALRPQVDCLVVYDNASTPPAYTAQADVILHDPLQPPNIAAFWNRAWQFCANLTTAPRWDVVTVGDDTAPYPGWVDLVCTAMRATTAVAACTRPVGAPILKTVPDSDIMHRLTGCAYALRGEAGLVADESMLWWWNDSDLDWSARLAGGMLVVPGPEVPNIQPNHYLTTRPDCAEQAGRDGETFVAKHGWRPW